MRASWLCAVVACGGGANGSNDANTHGGSDGASADAMSELRTGVVAVTEGNNLTQESAQFLDIAPGWGEAVIVRSDGACVVTVSTLVPNGSCGTVDGGTCAAPDFNADAGSIMISGGTAPTVLLGENPTTYQYVSKGQTSAVYAPGDVLTISASGGMRVARFSGLVTFPTAISVQSPTAPFPLNKTGFTATWSATTANVRIAIHQNPDPDHSTAIACDFAGSAATGSVPATALVDLVANTTAVVTVGAVADTPITAGAYDVTLEAANLGLGASPTVH